MARRTVFKYPMAQLDFVARLNDTFRYAFTYRTNPNNINVTQANVNDLPIVDVTGMSALMQIKNAPTDEAPLLELTSDSGITLDGDEIPNIIIVMTPEQTGSLPVDDYFYDLQLTDTLGQVTTIIGGIFSVEQDVSRPVEVEP